MQATIDRAKLFWASCLALLIPRVFFWISPKILNQRRTAFDGMVDDAPGVKIPPLFQETRQPGPTIFIYGSGRYVNWNMIVSLYNKTRIESIGLIPIILIAAFVG